MTCSDRAGSRQPDFTGVGGIQALYHDDPFRGYLFTKIKPVSTKHESPNVDQYPKF